MKSWLPAIFWALLIFAVSSIPSLKVTNDSWLQNLINNCGHFTEYAIFTYLIFRPLRFHHHLQGLKLYSLNFSLVVLYAASDEFHQHFVPGRMMDPHDLLLDALGSLTTIIVLSLVTRRRSLL
jgi:VanZ family protein